MKMADKFIFKMFLSFLFFLISYKSFCLAVRYKEENCSCYNICNKNFTMNTVQDVQKISACQRGCRFFSLVLHTSHGPDQTHDLKRAKEDCLLSCNGAYINTVEISSCKFGCAAIEMSRVLCNTVEIQMPQMMYFFMSEESDVLIHSGEPEPDDALMDPGLRKQIQKTSSLLDATQKVPEIRFTNLPIKTNKTVDSSGVLRHPKQCWFNSALKFRIKQFALCFSAAFTLVAPILGYVFNIFVEICIQTEKTQKMKMQNKNKLKKIKPLILVDKKKKRIEKIELKIENQKKEGLFCHDVIPAKLEVFQAGNNPSEEPFAAGVKKEEEQYGFIVQI